MVVLIWHRASQAQKSVDILKVTWITSDCTSAKLPACTDVECWNIKETSSNSHVDLLVFRLENIISKLKK